MHCLRAAGPQLGQPPPTHHHLLQARRLTPTSPPTTTYLHHMPACTVCVLLGRNSGNLLPPTTICCRHDGSRQQALPLPHTCTTCLHALSACCWAATRATSSHPPPSAAGTTAHANKPSHYHIPAPHACMHCLRAAGPQLGQPPPTHHHLLQARRLTPTSPPTTTYLHHMPACTVCVLLGRNSGNLLPPTTICCRHDGSRQQALPLPHHRLHGQPAAHAAVRQRGSWLLLASFCRGAAMPVAAAARSHQARLGSACACFLAVPQARPLQPRQRRAQAGWDATGAGRVVAGGFCGRQGRIMRLRGIAGVTAAARAGSEPAFVVWVCGAG